MTQDNTPGIGNALITNGLKYLPEAHCYLLIGDEKVDATNEQSDIARIEADILEEIEITPHQVGSFKVTHHQDFIRNWLDRERLGLSFKDVWRIRENCIANLEKAND